MNPPRLCAAILIAAALLTGCATPVQPEHYAQQSPKLDIQRYFNGTLDVHGMFQDRSGTVQKRFTVLMRCHWDGDVGTLDEEFSYSDGSKQRRVWTLRKTAPGRYTGTAPDVVGEASVDVAGNAMRLRYVLALPVDDKVYNVDFDDWLYLIDDRVMLNRASMSKFGFGLGSLTVAFNRREAQVPQ
ncbi:DUF3833 domain-containing protein [Duganella aceris]|uniref:DUF3833 domain-containing protein n=1 Tax=Duganella aceris TaxID=2703883 RepID=A0ABX0FMD0_9BURK|nr:DUF3833 domain-containing protein [Duganella aceris]NGZ85767.1 DUF3833 domain-containing protein [Duganella aceris]